jgi:hypothetical protein
MLHWLGGPLDVRVEVDTGLAMETVGLWDTGLWDEAVWGTADPRWQDVTPWVMEVQINAGAARWGERFESASAVLVVDNTEGVFTPDSDVPYFALPFRPARKIRVLVIDPDGVKQPLVTGQIDAINDSYDDGAYNLATTIACSDFMAVWAAYNPPMNDAGTGVQSTTDRIEAALDKLGWPTADRDLQTGVHTMQSSLLADSTLEECQKAADAEGGAFYADRIGQAVFKARDWLTTDPRSTTVQAWIGYDEAPTGAMAAHIIGVKTSHEAARIVNDVSYARVGSTLQHFANTGSQSAFGNRSYQRTDLENNSDAEVAHLAKRYLRAFKDDRARIDSVTIAATEDPDHNLILYDTRFGDLWSVLIDTPFGWSYEKEVHVMGLEHRITADDWVMSARLDDALTFNMLEPGYWDTQNWDEGFWQ